MDLFRQHVSLGLLFVAATVAANRVHADDDAAEIRAYRGGRILTATGVVFDPGTLLVEGKVIRAVGAVDDVEIPAGATIAECEGRVIIPGLVDTHSHLGVYSRPGVQANSDGNEMTGPVQSVVRALDSLNPFDPGIRSANAGGITTANVMPGSGNVIGGQTVYVKLRGSSVEEMRINSPNVVGGLKMANGENPKRTYGQRDQAPGTRMKIAALQRAEFIRAQEYMQKWDDYRAKLGAGEDVARPAVDLAMEPLVEVLQRKRTVHFHTHRADDILTVLRIRKEFGFELLIQHGTEAYKVIDEIARHQVPVSMTIVDSPGGKAEVVDFVERCGAEMAAAGVRVLINTDDPVTDSRFFLRTAAIAVRGGLAPELALQAITLNPAEVMHLDHRIGSLERGKDADFVILSGEPFSIYTRVLETFIEGKRVFSLDDERQRLFQTGGYSVHGPQNPPPSFPLVKASSPVAPVADVEGSAPVDSTTRDVAIVAGRVYTVSGLPIDDGVIIIREGKIVDVGPRATTAIPAGLPIVVGHVATPGMIDAHSVVPLSGGLNVPADQDQDEKSDPNQADVRVLDGFNPGEPLLRFLLEQGITVVHACPGRANVIAGATGIFRTHGRIAERMAIRHPHAMLMNLGEYPKETYPDRRPATRMGTAAVLRSALTEAQQARRPKANSPRDLKHEALQAVLDKKLVAMFNAQRADDIQTALRISREFGLDAQIALGAEAYQITGHLKRAGVPVIVHPTMQRNTGLETANTFLGNAAVLADAGIPLCMSSAFEGYVPKSRVIRHEAAMAMTYGLGFERALRSVTLDAAKILRIADQYGSLESGKVGDVVLFDGDPFEHATHVTHVFVDGSMVFDRSTRRPIPLAHRALLSIPALPCCAW